MAGIYIHIPFCKQACHYCDFHFSTSLKNKQPFLKALRKEIELRKDFLIGTDKDQINTIYFGGGTPSLLSDAELMNIFEVLYSHFKISPEAEITLEANPDDLTKERMQQLSNSPVNRLSIGIQSFYNDDLQLMNRAHTDKEALDVVKMAQDCGFLNISIDLIYGIPTLTNCKWENNLKKAFELDVKHISAYCLTVEPRTALSKLISSGKIKNVNEEISAEQFEIMLKQMEANNYQQYEISNFCKDGFYSQHNSNYWFKEQYLGFGPSAHSFNGEIRQWNISNNMSYIRALENAKEEDIEKDFFEKEVLTLNQRYNEYILTSLRTIWGTDLEFIEKQFGTEILNYCLKEAQLYFELSQLLQKNNRLFLTDNGKLFADKIASDLFIV
jgi:oxygen-independent coproporphyrinogen-3 oxidase